jgi:hypothetical protein
MASSRDRDRHGKYFEVVTMSAYPRRLATRCAHGGASRRGPGRADEPFQRPIVQSTIFDLGTSEPGSREASPIV